MGVEESTIAAREFSQIAVPETLPDLGLPEMVETFDCGLKPGFPRRGEDRHDALIQTKADESAESSYRAGGTGKACVIVHLQIGRGAPLPPMRGQHWDD